METKDKEFLKRLHEWQEKSKKTSLNIGRIPEKYKTRFMEIAKEEFSFDYGMCLREMIRTWDGVYLPPDEELNAKIDLLAKEVSELKEKIETKKEENVLRAADGSIKRTGG